jgi:hypothetical protein
LAILYRKKKITGSIIPLKKSAIKVILKSDMDGIKIMIAPNTIWIIKNP